MEIQLDKLTKQYGSGTAVDGVSIVLKPGVYGLLGANGAGKTGCPIRSMSRRSRSAIISHMKISCATRRPTGPP